MFKRGVNLLVIATLFFPGAVFARALESSKLRLPSNKQRLEQVDKRVTNLTEKLSLNEEQKLKITEIVTKVKEESATLLRKTADKIAELKRRAEDDIEGVLTKEQKDKFNGLSEEDDNDDILKIFKGQY